MKFLKELPIRKVYRDELDGYLYLLEHLNKLERKVSASIRKSLKDDPRAELLMTVPGISYLTAHLLLAEIGDISRFPSSKKLLFLCCFMLLYLPKR